MDILLLISEFYPLITGLFSFIFSFILIKSIKYYAKESLDENGHIKYNKNIKYDFDNKGTKFIFVIILHLFLILIFIVLGLKCIYNLLMV